MSTRFPCFAAYVSPQGNDDTGQVVVIGSSTSIPTTPTNRIVFRTIDAAYAAIRRQDPNYLTLSQRSRIYTFAIDIPSDLEEVVNFVSPYEATREEYAYISFEVISQANSGIIVPNPADFNTLIYSSITFTGIRVRLDNCAISYYLIKSRRTSDITSIGCNLSNNAFVDTGVVARTSVARSSDTSVQNLIAIITPQFPDENLFKIISPFDPETGFNASILFVIDLKGINLFVSQDSFSGNGPILITSNQYSEPAFITSSGNFSLFSPLNQQSNNLILDTVNIDFFLSDQQTKSLISTPGGLFRYTYKITNSQLESNIRVMLESGINNGSGTILSSALNLDGVILDVDQPNTPMTNIVKLAKSKVQTLAESRATQDNTNILNYLDQGNQVRNTKTFYVPNRVTKDYVVSSDSGERTESTTYLIDASNNDVNFTLPANQMDGYYVIVKRTDYSDNRVRIIAPPGTSIEGHRRFYLQSQHCSKKHNKAYVLPKKTFLFSDNVFYIV